MPEHGETDRIILRKMRMSEQSELTPQERNRMKLCRSAYATNPLVNGERLYRILRPREDDE